MNALNEALEKAGAPNLEIVASESEWLSDGNPVAIVKNAGTYFRNWINHVKARKIKGLPGGLERLLKHICLRRR